MKFSSQLKIIKSESGRTLIEIVASLAILAIIIIPFASLFVQSGKNLNKSEEIMDATYIAQSVMEEVYHFSKTVSFNSEQIKSNLTGESINYTDGKYYFNRNDYYVELSLEKKSAIYSNLVNVLVKVYPDDSKKVLDAQMETIVNWED